MTAQPSRADFERNSTLILAQARSEWLNRFSRLEIAVMKCEERFCGAISPRGTQLAQRLTAITKTVGSKSKAQLTVLRLIQQCEGLLPLRASIVHSEMCVKSMDGEDAAVFQNSVDAACDNPIFAILTKDDFARGCRNLQSLTDRLKSLSKPSLPPPPKPAATAGP